jgi:hypothetical protein
MLFVIKNFLALRTIESIWLQRLALYLCLRMNFLFRTAFTKEVSFCIGEQDLDKLCATCLGKCRLITTCTFNLWMSIFGQLFLPNLN